jgi:hypothetical protein
MIPVPVATFVRSMAIGGALLACMGCIPATPVLGADPISPAVRRAPLPDAPNWVPFRGTLRVARTWGHGGGHGYPAVDWDLPSGRRVRVFAAGPGTVLSVTGTCPDTTADGAHGRCNAGHGNTVDIVHPDGTRSRYFHLQHGGVVVEPGDHVCRGCQIAWSGWSGNVSPPGPDGAHIHYEELRSSQPVPPGPMFAKRGGHRVRYRGGPRAWRKRGVAQVQMWNSGFPRPGPAPVGRCLGWAPTIEGSGEIDGTSGPDIILGSEGPDTIRGHDGGDRLCGSGGDDLLIGGLEEDLLDGGAGADTCYSSQAGATSPGEAGTSTGCEKPPFVLTVVIEGATLVESDDGGIICPGDCSEPYDEGTVVTLSATPPDGNDWEGCDFSTANECTVTMQTDRTVRV